MQDQPIPTPATKPPRKRKTSTPRAPRVKDPGILAIEREAAERKAQYRLAQRSSGILERILKLVGRLVAEDKNKLSDALKLGATPQLPLT
jgi:hypothetical protein